MQQWNDRQLMLRASPQEEEAREREVKVQEAERYEAERRQAAREAEEERHRHVEAYSRHAPLHAPTLRSVRSLKTQLR